MIDRLVHFCQSSRLLGIEYDVTNQVLRSKLCAFSKDGSLAILDEFGSLEEIQKYLEDNHLINISLALYGDFIVHIHSDREVDEENLVQIISEEFPQFNPEDFFITYRDKLIVLARNDDIIRALESIGNLSAKISKISFGLSNEYSISLGLDQVGLQIPVGRYIINPDIGEFRSNDNTGKATLNLGDSLTVSSYEAPSVIAALDGVTPLSNMRHNQKFSAQFEERKYAVAYKRLLMPTLVFLLAVLLCNSIMYMIVSEDNQRLKSESNSVLRLEAKREEMSSEVSAGQKYLSGFNRYYSYSQISDQLGFTLPSKILLTELLIDRSIVKDRKKVQIPYVHIKGNSPNPNELTKWLDSIKEMDWVEGVENQQFTRKSDGVGKFEIKLTQKERE